MTEFFIDQHFKDKVGLRPLFFVSTTTSQHCFRLERLNWSQVFHTRDHNVPAMEFQKITPASKMHIFVCIWHEMTGIVLKKQNPGRMVIWCIKTWFKLVIFTMDFLQKYRITTRFSTNWNSKCIFFNQITNESAPALKVDKIEQYVVEIVFMLYIWWKQNGMVQTVVLLVIWQHVINQEKFHAICNGGFNGIGARINKQNKKDLLP